jgi:hypothetical protein
MKQALDKRRRTVYLITDAQGCRKLIVSRASLATIRHTYNYSTVEALVREPIK